MLPRCARPVHLIRLGSDMTAENFSNERTRRRTTRPFGYTVRRAVEIMHERTITLLATVALYLKCLALGIRCGRGVQAYGRVIIRSPGAGVEIGNGVKFVSSSWRCASSALAHPVRLRTFSPEARIILEDGVGLNGTSITARSRTIRVGRDTMIGPDCMIIDSDFHLPWPPEARSDYAAEHDAGVNIGENVWIGARCIILKGASIGAESVVAAGSVVKGNVPRRVLVAGNPAQVVKQYDADH